jgi:hypothetical protein
MLKALQSNPLDVGKKACRLPGWVIRRLAQTNYYTARAYYLHDLRRADSRYEAAPLLVHQMGKVASSSVTRSLKEANIGRPTKRGTSGMSGNIATCVSG